MMRKWLVLNETNMIIFHLLKVMSCSSEAQLQVGENLNKKT